MTIIGTVQNGRIVLPEGVVLPEGAEVAVEVHTALPAGSSPTPDPAHANTETGRRLLKLAATCRGLPEDLSANVDHYLYGAPKR